MHIVDQNKLKNSNEGGIFDGSRKHIDELNNLADVFESQTFNAVIPTYNPRKEEDNGPIISLNDINNYDINELEEDLYDYPYEDNPQINNLPQTHGIIPTR